MPTTPIQNSQTHTIFFFFFSFSSFSFFLNNHFLNNINNWKEKKKPFCFQFLFISFHFQQVYINGQIAHNQKKKKKLQ